MLDETTTGHALLRLRELSGMHERAAARAIGVSRSELRAWESQRAMPDDAQLARAISVYGHDLHDVIAARRPLTDPERPGVLIIGDEEIFVADHLQDTSDPHQRNAALLHTYLDAVRRQRGVPTGHPVELRSDDLSSLAIELDLGDDHLQGLLAELLDLTPIGAQFTVRALLVGALLALLASGAVQSTWLAPTASATTTSPTAPAVVVDQALPAPQTFAAGDLGPTVRGPTFAPVELITTDTPPAPVAEVTPDEVPYAIFSVDPTTAGSDRERDPVLDVDADMDPATAVAADGSAVFSVTPRRVFHDPSPATDPASPPAPAGPAALPPGSRALPPGD